MPNNFLYVGVQTNPRILKILCVFPTFEMIQMREILLKFFILILKFDFVIDDYTIIIIYLIIWIVVIIKFLDVITLFIVIIIVYFNNHNDDSYEYANDISLIFYGIFLWHINNM